MEALFSANEGKFDKALAWEALERAQQLPNPEEITSNTQWSVVYNSTDKTAGIVLRRKWGDVTVYDLLNNTVRR